MAICHTMKNNYSRPYCEKCNLIYGKENIGIILDCQKCKQKLTLKDFSPLPKVVSGVAFIALGIFTIATNLPYIWVGGFVAGGILIYSGLETAGKIEDLDQGKKRDYGQYERLYYNNLRKLFRKNTNA